MVFRDMPDKTQTKRTWLSYSKVNDKAYCVACMLFSGPRGSDVWTTSGCSHWSNGIRDIMRHEQSQTVLFTGRLSPQLVMYLTKTAMLWQRKIDE